MENAPSTPDKKPSTLAFTSYLLGIIAAISMGCIGIFTGSFIISPPMDGGSIAVGMMAAVAFGFLSGAFAVIFGHVAQARGKLSPDLLKGKKLANIGLILGYVSIVATIIVLAISIPAFETAVIRRRWMSELYNGVKISDMLRWMSLEGRNSGDKPMGYSADAGITSVHQLKALLQEKDFLPQYERYLAAKLDSGDILIGNVSTSDPPHTIFIRSAPSPSLKGGFVLRLNGDGETFFDTPPAGDPPRSPPYLTP